MEFWGYGEDVLTLWALRKHLGEILLSVEDESAPDLAKVIYRPSFGRNSSNNPEAPRASFGEFDAIVRTQARIYLIETKWPGSREYKKRARRIDLAQPQVRRHEAMHFYLQRWAEAQEPEREAFPQTAPANLGLVIPGEESVLRRSLRWVCSCLDPQEDTPIIDVLLWVGIHEATAPLTVSEPQFRLVVINADGAEQEPEDAAAGYMRPL